MTDDERYLDLLAIFHFIFGGLVALFSCIPIIHIILGIAMVAGAFAGDDAPPAVIGFVFIAIGALVILIGWAFAFAIITAGRKLKARQSRTFCVVVAALECMSIPFGTILGIFTIIVLMKEPVVAMFEGNRQAV
ncbi:MAG: hypothetical protein AMXMBFR84_18190 [Candidatus Hydrogenedentota bacterium]